MYIAYAGVNDAFRQVRCCTGSGVLCVVDCHKKITQHNTHILVFVVLL
jgi:hypothetical protein